jgi:dATP pyrophosphohydrolase
MKIISNLVEVHIFRKRKEGIEFLLLKRAQNQIYPGIWQMVSGKIKADEKAYETAIREVKEETGLTPSKIWVAPKVNSFYSDESDTICLVPVFAIQVDKKTEVKLSKEHTEFKWVKSKKAKIMLAWEGQRKALELIEEYFLNERSFLNFVEVKLPV